MFKLVARRAARQVRELTVRAEFARDKVFHLLYRTPFLTHLWVLALISYKMLFCKLSVGCKTLTSWTPWIFATSELICQICAHWEPLILDGSVLCCGKANKFCVLASSLSTRFRSDDWKIDTTRTAVSTRLLEQPPSILPTAAISTITEDARCQGAFSTWSKLNNCFSKNWNQIQMHQLTIPALEQLSTTCPNTMVSNSCFLIKIKISLKFAARHLHPRR